MRNLQGRKFRFALLVLTLVAVVAMPAPAYAQKNRTIILKAAGSGAVLGLGAGLISYPFAKSTGTIIAGVALGAIFGTVYGFHLVNQRDEAFRQVEVAPSELDHLADANAARDANLYRVTVRGNEIFIPVSLVSF